MTRDNAKMVDLPWIDGTTRTVPEWTRYESLREGIVYARDGGCSYRSYSGEILHVHHSGSQANPGYVLTRNGWRGLRTYTKYDPSDIADRLREGARVLYEGEDTP